MTKDDTQGLTPPYPYPGLRPFRRDEAAIFFGRDEQVDQLLQKLEDCRFLAVVGPSGCGKSSLVRAGMIPSLEAGFMGSHGFSWRVAVMTPGNCPIRNLAGALLDADLFDTDLPNKNEDLTFLYATLRRGELGLVEALEHSKLGQNENLLILVDQFEELFRFAQVADSDEAIAFIDLVLASCRQTAVPVFATITMRSDFLGKCLIFTGLPEAMNNSQFLTPRLTRDQTDAAITGPLSMFCAKIEDDVVNHIINEMGTESDQLPLMQHLLMRMWRLASGGKPATELTEEVVLSLKHYEEAGGFEGALSNHANKTYEDLKTEEQKLFAERMFRHLTEITPDGQFIRRPAPLSKIWDATQESRSDVTAVLDAFRAEGRSFLRPPISQELTPETVIDISHESLIRQWDLLRQWTIDEEKSRRIHEHFHEEAMRWEESGKNENVLLTGVRLAEAMEWSERHSKEVEEVEREFLMESEKHRDAQVLMEEEAKRAEVERKRAEAERKHAEAERERAKQAELLAEEKTKRAEVEAKRAEQAELLAEEEAKRAEAERERAEQAEWLAEEKVRSASRLRRLVAALVTLVVVLIVAIASILIANYYYEAKKTLEESQRTLSQKIIDLTDQLSEFSTLNIEELRNNPETRAIAERWEAELKKLIPVPEPRTLTPTEWLSNLKDLRELIEAHNEVLKKLNAVDEPASETVEEFTLLYEKLKGLSQLTPFFEETSSFSRDFEKLKERIQTLDKIRSQSNPEIILEIAQTAEYTEAINAAWKRLGELPGSQWPNDKNDLDIDRNIRECLKNRFETIRLVDEKRGNSLRETLVRTGLKYERGFIERNKRSQDKVLGEFYTFALPGILPDTPDEFESLESLARRLSDFITDPDWPDKYEMDPQKEGNPLYAKTNLTQTDFEKWLNEAGGYRILRPDPRPDYRPNQIVQDVNQLIVGLRPNLPGKAEEFQKSYDDERQEIKELFEIPAIVKNEERIKQAVVDLKGVGERLIKLKADVKSCIFPPWCTNVSIVKDAPEGQYKVVLKSEQLRGKFAPLRASDKLPIEVDQGRFEGFDRDDFTDDGWPKYIASPNDLSVVLRFIPAGADNPKPFYMATREITYTQYVLFLKDDGQPVGYEDQNKFGKEDKTFISWTEIDYPPCPIEWKDKTFDVNNYIGSGDLPVTYVTYDGAQSYADWLGGQLPDARQHRYASRAGTTSRYFWGENISDILEYAHVRAEPWRQAVQMYNEKKDRLSALAILPIGAVQSDEDYMNEPDPDPLKNKGLILNRVIAQGDPKSSYEKRSEWPIVSSTQPNEWGLYDMIGNVWEWCQDGTQPVICGGSCLAPPECITDDSMYSKSLKSQYQGQPIKDKDIGFRVAVPAI